MSGLQIVASHSYREVVDGLDTLVVVGGSGCEAAIKDSMLIDWVRSIAPKSTEDRFDLHWRGGSRRSGPPRS